MSEKFKNFSVLPMDKLRKSTQNIGMHITDQRTYCNPIPLPDYPWAGMARIHKNDKEHLGWVKRKHNDHRSAADPSVLFHEDTWYLYPSDGMAYLSRDLVHWEHHRLEPYEVGWAPTVMHLRGKFYLTACQAPLYVADHPLGPFKEIGPMLAPDGTELVHKKEYSTHAWADPMLFADDDGAAYAYWGISDPGVFGARLNPDKLNQLTSEPKLLFSHHPDHRWEFNGDFNEDSSRTFMEGPWMFKHGGRYFLTYAAGGTQYRSYAMGTYVGDGPLGPFHYQKRNPILRDTTGLVHGPGHGSIFPGPNNTIWACYTCGCGNEHLFERRIGIDPAGFDSEGNLFVKGASETPQWAPGLVADPANEGNDAGLLPVTVTKRVYASSERYGLEAFNACDNLVRTRWEAAPDDKAPWLEVDLVSLFRISAIRILWAEPGLDYTRNILPGPFRYRVLVSESETGDSWSEALDRSMNATDFLIDYRTFSPIRARRLKLEITGIPEGLNTSIISFTAFGICDT